jgi:hypothetical protein
MPRSLQEILSHADELAHRFEDYEPRPGDRKDAGALREIRKAYEDLLLAQRRLADAVSVARAEGCAWGTVGMMLGTSGEAARQRYGGVARPKKSTARKATARVTEAARKTTTKKTTARKTTAVKKTAARKTTARKTTARKAPRSG